MVVFPILQLLQEKYFKSPSLLRCDSHLGVLQDVHGSE